MLLILVEHILWGRLEEYWNDPVQFGVELLLAGDKLVDILVVGLDDILGLGVGRRFDVVLVDMLGDIRAALEVGRFEGLEDCKLWLDLRLVRELVLELLLHLNK